MLIGTNGLSESDKLPLGHKKNFYFSVQAYGGNSPVGLLNIVTVRGTCLVDAITNYIASYNKSPRIHIDHFVINGFICDFIPDSEGYITDFCISTPKFVITGMSF